MDHWNESEELEVMPRYAAFLCAMNIGGRIGMFGALKSDIDDFHFNGCEVY